MIADDPGDAHPPMTEEQPRPVYTIGHSTRTIEQFVGLLKEHGIELLVDVRRFPGSRRHPQFGSVPLAASLAEEGIGYVHAEALGGRRSSDAAGGPSPNGAWRHSAFRAYADYMATPDFQRALERLIDLVDPDREPGRLTLITRMGSGRIRDALPPLLEAVGGFGATPLWITDPMHGNGITTPTGYKTRRFDDVVDEVLGFFAAHREVGTHPGGMHVELTGDDVTECLGGAEEIADSDLGDRYETMCDPRLNGRQSLDLAFRVSELLRG